MKGLLQVYSYDIINLKIFLLFLFKKNLIKHAFIFNNLNVLHKYKNKLVKDKFYYVFLIINKKNEKKISLYMKKKFSFNIFIFSLL